MSDSEESAVPMTSSKDEDIIVKKLKRSALGPNVTRITLETFLAWKKRKRLEKVAKAEQDMERKRADFKAGRSLGVSGREVFEFRPELVNDDDEEADDTEYAKSDDDDDIQKVEDSQEFQDIDVARFVLKEVDLAGITMASTDRFTAKETDYHKLSEAEVNGIHPEDKDLEDEEAEVVPVDENLFTGEDLDELAEELNTLKD